MVASALILSPHGTIARLSATLPKGWEDWEPEVLRPAVKSLPVSWDIVQAVRALLLNPESFQTDFDVFENTVIAFCARPVDTEHVSVCTPAEILWGVSQAFAIRGKRESFGADVVAYVRGCMLDAGVFGYPAELRSFEPSDETELRESIRRKQAAGAENLESEDLVDVQAAKLSQVYASMSMIAAKFSDVS